MGTEICLANEDMVEEDGYCTPYELSVGHRIGVVMNERCLDPLQVSKWIAPSSGHIKVNYDSPTFWNGGELGVGVVDQGASGECLARLSKCVLRLGDGEVAEALSAREAIILSQHKVWHLVIFEGDCATLIHKILFPNYNLSTIGPIIVDIRTFTFRSRFVSFQLVKRFCNGVAHALS
ncbi:UNVERIFIED_CONTAM: hypothetical protein Scaly_0942300 [Sesamum calycinum]|uniref:RNase H type-1 domain-containing protein n=1 Tax=Sesamum calycinum TaxID=2727403 RepID=A0AAW2QXR9_9LAMI